MSVAGGQPASLPGMLNLIQGETLRRESRPAGQRSFQGTIESVLLLAGSWNRSLAWKRSRSLTPRFMSRSRRRAPNLRISSKSPLAAEFLAAVSPVRRRKQWESHSSGSCRTSPDSASIIFHVEYGVTVSFYNDLTALTGTLSPKKIDRSRISSPGCQPHLSRSRTAWRS